MKVPWHLTGQQKFGLSELNREAPLSYQSVDKLQSALATEVFHYAKDSKKAAGRALGTLIELVTFYLLKDWGVESATRIEKALFEYKNSAISHNVEYTLHPIKSHHRFEVALSLPLTSTKILRELEKSKEIDLSDYQKVNSTLVSNTSILKNSCVIARSDGFTLVAVLKSVKDDLCLVEVTEQLESPYVMVECKRVGVEEGMKKGPQTIEKAKQGAYVARSVSSLQKVRNFNGALYGILPIDNEAFRFELYENLMQEILTTKDPKVFTDFIMSVGVVSNHGNWFTAENANKELQVLADAYDWLLFLTDEGLATFIDELLLNPEPRYIAAQTAFRSSYSSNDEGIRKTGQNRFTKSQIGLEADEALQDYFRQNRDKIETWFNIITPSTQSIAVLREQIKTLSLKEWHL